MMFRSKFGAWTKSQAGLGRCLEPWKNKTISEVVMMFALVCTISVYCSLDERKMQPLQCCSLAVPHIRPVDGSRQSYFCIVQP